MHACRQATVGRKHTRKLGGFAWPASPDRILTTHVGSLVRPPKLVEFLKLIEAGQPYDKAAYEACLKASIEEVVRQQVEAGVDIVSDGEFSKGRNWAFYVHDRLSGLTTRPATPEEMKDPLTSAGGGQDQRGVSGILRRVQPRLGPRRAARQPLRRQRPPHLQRRAR